MSMTNVKIGELIVLVVSAVGLVLSYPLTSSALAIISAICLFSTFDAIGYHRLIDENKSKLAYYRTVQTVFQHIITAYLWYNFGIWSATIYIVAWWFGVCDILYYVILKKNYFTYGPMFWLWWTPLGIIASITARPIMPIPATIQAILGFVVSVLLYSYFV